jgi:hypothetical protein
MGRRARIRRRKRNVASSDGVSVGGDRTLITLFHWLSRHGWRPAAPLRLAAFSESGRGLMTVSSLQPNSLIVSIPTRLLVTRHTAALSLGVEDERAFPAHDLLAVFILTELLQDRDSFWLPYLDTFPTGYTVPYYCTASEVEAFPAYVREKCEQQRRAVGESFKRVERLLPHSTSVHAYSLAYFTVNTRAVYLQESP